METIGPANLEQRSRKISKAVAMEQERLVKQRMQKKKEPVGSPGAIYLLLSSKGWRGKRVASSLLAGESESEDRMGR